MAGDVDTGTVVGKRASNHKADTCATSSDYADPALDIEETGRAELRVFSGHVLSDDGCGETSSSIKSVRCSSYGLPEDGTKESEHGPSSATRTALYWRT